MTQRARASSSALFGSGERHQSGESSAGSVSKPAITYTVAVGLTWIAGLVDAVGFLTFSRIYTANMSGNSVALGIGLDHRKWPDIALRFWPILLYVFGLIIGRMAIEIGARRRMRRIASIAFGFEVLLLVFAILSGKVAGAVPHAQWVYVGIALLATAMGIQNAALTHFSSLTLHSGFVTGTLLKFAEELVRYGTWVWDNLKQQGTFSRALAKSACQPSFRLSLFLAVTWLAYVIGAITGAWGTSVLRLNTLVIAIAGLVLLIAVDVFSPLAIQEEKEQVKG